MGAMGHAPGTRTFLGAALWLPPGVEPDEAALALLLKREVPPERLGDLFEMLERMGRHHPAQPHWYLPLIGVDPEHQGRGHGSALLRHAAERLGRSGEVAYLESTNPLNLPLYRRFGFEVWRGGRGGRRAAGVPDGAAPATTDAPGFLVSHTLKPANNAEVTVVRGPRHSSTTGTPSPDRTSGSSAAGRCSAASWSWGWWTWWELASSRSSRAKASRCSRRPECECE